VNRIALTTAVAAHRAVELSLIPDEAASEDRRRENWAAIGRRLFKRSNTNQQSLAHSESFLRLTEETSLPPFSPNDIKSTRSSRASSRASL
uniref:Uncharacterized protein n=1 Tax=Acrobeloides nanus TaxID=290746 RepID=A0A914CNJ1_9BILA